MKMLIGVLIALIVCAGCIQQFWPTDQASNVAVKYAGKDPNDFSLPVSTVGNLEKLKVDTDKTYLDNRTMLEARLAIEEGTYQLVGRELNVKIETGKQQFAEIVGTVQAPGWGLTALFTLLGISGMKAYDKNTMYSEAEVEKIKTPS